MENDNSIYQDPKMYLQIGCKFYFRYSVPDARGHMVPVLKEWSFAQIKKDFKNNPADLDNIHRFISQGCFPSHTNYQESVGRVYNTYCPLSWRPVQGEWPTIESMLRHIFDDQFEYGLDYIQLLYLNPQQMLPILLLVSEERETGKTTFLDFLKEIFGPNMVFVTNETMRSPFNSDRACRLIMACDETFLNKKEDSERLKALSTAKKTYVEYKGKDRYEIDNFVKILLCSNNTNDPVYIDGKEVRYWVREVPRLEHDCPNILEAMKIEIPAFLGYLMTRQLHVSFAKSRMWFDTNELRTPALERIIRACRPSEELELAEMLLDMMDRFNVDELCYTTADLINLQKVVGREIRGAHRIVCKQWRVPHAPNKMAYDLYMPYADVKHQYGRYYTFTRTLLTVLVPD